MSLVEERNRHFLAGGLRPEGEWVAGLACCIALRLEPVAFPEA
jgi:hypothetical protein